MKVRILSQYSDSLHDSVLRLLPQLDPAIVPPSKDFLRKMLDSRCVDLFIAEDEENVIAGMLTLVNYPNVTGLKTWIEDVVVDGSYRGKGIGELLIMAAIDRARNLGAVELKLTSRPFREAANKLYRKLGFQAYETNVYKFRL